MCSLRWPACALIVLGAVCLQAQSAFAQVGNRPERPDRGLYKNRPTGSGDLLDVNGSAGIGWDNNLLLTVPGISDPRVPAEAGLIGLFTGGASFTRTRERSNFNASTASAARYYPGQGIDRISGYNASVGGAMSPSDRTGFWANQLVSYEPFTFSSIFPQTYAPVFEPGGVPPAEAVAPSLDQAALAQQYLSYQTNAGLYRRMSQRTTFSAGYHFLQGDSAYVHDKFTNQGAYAGLRYSATRNLGFRAGYGYQQGSYLAGTSPIRTHNIDAGVDYNRALSFSRRTTFSFSTGTSAMTDGFTTHYQVVGGARLNHEMGRTWNASLSYDRSFQFVQSLLQPVFYDSANAGVGGLINRRLRADIGARASIGSVGLGDHTADNGFDTYEGFASLSFALSRFAELGANYTIYRYRFGSSVVLPIGVAHDVERQSVGVHVSVWAPLYNRVRSGSATR